MPVRRARRPILSTLRFEPDPGLAIPAAVTAFLADAGARIDAFFETWKQSRNLGFFPSDHELVYDALRSVRKTSPEATRLCEWGSGFGVVAGLAAMLGFEACGIELDARCVAASRSLLGDHHLDVSILEGSFVPAEYADHLDMSPDGTGTVLWGPGAIDEVHVEIEDFDVIFAFPWPDEQDLYSNLFARYAAVGAILVTYSALDGIRVRRKTGA